LLRLLRFVGLGLGLIAIVSLIAAYGVKPHTEDSPSYWVWKSSDMAWVGGKSTLYLYQGDIGLSASGPPFIKRGIYPRADLGSRDIILLVRLYERGSAHDAARELIYLHRQWAKKGVEVKEIQLDHDSPSRLLSDYADYVAALTTELQHTLPHVRISITGLSTWLLDNPKGLHKLAEQTAYIHFQLYSDFHPLPRVERYLTQLSRYTYPYKIGVTTSAFFYQMEFVPNEHYLGKTVFLNK
jgi:hypothetical protein